MLWDSPVKEGWLSTLELKYGAQLEYGNTDGRAFFVEYVKTKKLIKEWDMVGHVPLSIWDLMNEEERGKVMFCQKSSIIERVMFLAIALLILVPYFYLILFYNIETEVIVSIMFAGMSVPILISIFLYVNYVIDTITEAAYKHMLPPIQQTIKKTGLASSGALTVCGNTRAGDLTLISSGNLELCHDR